ncbi:MAG: Uma2 family endonuclease [Oligoflexia bacterium]|nr:Uma2 family endonuclease [Oligoflexia bacterium]
MSSPLPADAAQWSGAIVYPDSDGQPMADNTEQFEFIQTFQGNLDALLKDFVAGDHLWYPVQGQPDIRVAPDVYVALGRPKGHRGSYKQWEEDDTPPHVVFEWWSPNSDFPQHAQKLRFYDRYGVQEFYAFDQIRHAFSAFIRQGDQLEAVSTEDGFTSPLLGVRFAVVDGHLKAWHPDGRPFLSMVEMDAARAQAQARADTLAAQLRELGIDPQA